MARTDIVKLLKIFSFPILLYGIQIVFRLFDLQPEVEEGHLGDFITSLNFLFGAFVAYFVFIFFVVSKPVATAARSLWWWGISILLTFLAFDELYRIHENLGEQLGIEDTLILLAYGVVFLGLLLFNLNAAMRKEVLLFLILFGIFGVISQVSDYFFFEGTISLAGKEISYEQYTESFGALCLTGAIVTMAWRTLFTSAMVEDEEATAPNLTLQEQRAS